MMVQQVDRCHICHATWSLGQWSPACPGCKEHGNPKQPPPRPPEIQPWHVCTNKAMQRRYGKLLEELGELTSVVARCTIQGVDEFDPSDGHSNRVWLENEIADVVCQIELLVVALGLNRAHMATRQMDKANQMAQWERLVNDGN